MTRKDEIEATVKQRFSAIARDPAGETRFRVGPESAKALGYPAEVIDALPAGLTESFAGVGHPLGIFPPEQGESVLDLGCGAGLDLVLAARAVGPGGRAIGVDFAEAMAEKARANAALVGTPVEVLVAPAEALPLAEATIDHVITNGVFNLCFDKTAVVGEWWRVLRPGGRLQMADILLEDHVTPEDLARLGEWSA